MISKSLPVIFVLLFITACASRDEFTAEVTEETPAYVAPTAKRIR